MKISQLKPGSVAYTVTKSKMGNTTMKTVNVHEVIVNEVHEEEGYVVASWNCNQARKYFSFDVAKWKKTRPVLIRNSLGQSRLATKEEKAEILAKEKEGKTTS